MNPRSTGQGPPGWVAGFLVSPEAQDAAVGQDPVPHQLRRENPCPVLDQHWPAVRRAGPHPPWLPLVLGDGPAAPSGGLALAWNSWRPAWCSTAYTVTTLADGVAGSLRDAITQRYADHGTDTVNFKPGLTGTIVLSAGETTTHHRDYLTITGPGANKLTVSGTLVLIIFHRL